MQFTIAAIAAFAASASAMALNTTASAGPVYVTEVVTHLTTYCPASTVVTAGSHTITVTAATTLTIEDCSCTITKQLSTSAVPTAPATSATYVSAPVYHNGTTATVTSAHGTGAAHSTGASTSTAKPSQFTGAASSMNVAGAAAAALGMAALIL
ncbi:hypothetical protein KCU65_g8761, partial [Aureobasidium melanogenum]